MAISVKKVYPIKGRKDFYKYVVIDNGVIAKGFQGNSFDEPMYFNTKERAEEVANARRIVQKLNRKYSVSKNKK